MGIQQMLIGGRTPPAVLVHHTGEGGGEGVYVAAAGDCSVLFQENGIFSGTTDGGGTGTSPYNWLVSGQNTDVEIFFHVTSGTLTGATQDTWLVLSSDRGVNLSWPGGVGTSGGVVEVSMRDAVTQALLIDAVELQLATHP
jgi:hypothetical protein